MIEFDRRAFLNYQRGVRGYPWPGAPDESLSWRGAAFVLGVGAGAALVVVVIVRVFFT